MFKAVALIGRESMIERNCDGREALRKAGKGDAWWRNDLGKWSGCKDCVLRVQSSDTSTLI